MPPPALVDSHCHLDFPDFAGETDAVVARAAAAGVTRMVTICTRLRQAATVRAIAEAHEGVFWAAGIHPMHVAEEPMATVNFSVPDEVKEAFDRAFKNQNKSAVIADLMRHAVAEVDRRKRRVRIFRELTANRSQRARATDDELRKARRSGRA